jgi:anoctamin-10
MYVLTLPQFGYLSLFSVVWPFTPVSFLVNNWVELRADALKISVEMQRPLPHRADTIGPWLDSLSFLTWLGCLTSSALVYMFSNDGVGSDGTPYAIKAWALLLVIFSSEQIYLSVQWAVRKVVSKLGSPAMAQDRRRKYLLRQRYVDQSFKMVSGKTTAASAAAAGLGIDESSTFEKIDKASLEDHARNVASVSPEEGFWMKQKGWKETANVGQSLIGRMVVKEEESKKTK